MSPPSCSFCSHPAAGEAVFCPRCGAEVPGLAGEELVLLHLRAVRVMLRNRVLPTLAPRLKVVGELLAHDPELVERCEASLVWTGLDAQRLLDEEANLPRVLPVVEGVVALLPPGALPDFRTNVADHRRMRDALIETEAAWRPTGPPAARKVEAWFDALVEDLGFDHKGVRACVYASPGRWPTVARALDADAFAAARLLLDLAAAEAQFAQKNFGLARARFEAARARDPACAAALDGLARCAIATGDPAAAVELLREAIRLGAADPHAYNRFAWFLCTEGIPTLAELAEAVAAARRAVEFAPAVGAYWDTLAEALERAGDPRGAIAAARESLRWGPISPLYRARMARLCGMLAPPEFTEPEAWEAEGADEPVAGTDPGGDVPGLELSFDPEPAEPDLPGRGFEPTDE